MQITPVVAVMPASTVFKVSEKQSVSEPERLPPPEYNRNDGNISKSVEISKDPPGTVLKYTNNSTGQVEFQVPSEVQLRIYKDTQRFLSEQNEVKKNIAMQA